jgi:acetyltransferase-like isoleucine patch superfamily enzyme
LWASETRFYQKKWKRCLPFGEIIVDRWAKAKALGFGKNSSIYDSALVFGKVKVGKSTWIGPFCILDGSGGLKIGDYCSISAGTQIYTHDTVLWANSGGRHPPQRGKVKIGSRCYLGPNVLVSRGVTIGSGCVIGANSFVNRNVPAGAKAWGSPLRIIRA